MIDLSKDRPMTLDVDQGVFVVGTQSLENQVWHCDFLCLYLSSDKRNKHLEQNVQNIFQKLY